MKASLETTSPGVHLLIHQGRLRSGWRLLVYFLMLLAGIALFSLPVGLGVMLGLPDWSLSFLSLVAYLGGTLSATWLARRFLDKRSFLDLGLHLAPGWWQDLLFGVALGGVLMLGIFAIETGAGWAEVTGLAWQTQPPAQWVALLLLAVWQFVVVGIVEEVIARGYLLQTLAEGLNLRWAVLLSSIIFGLMHFANPYLSAIAILNLIVAGLFLAAGYLVTRQLWLPIGLHFGWNFFQGTVFGFPVSGTTDFSLIALRAAGPEWVTGGDFGPEAGLTGLVAMLVGMILIGLWARRASRGVQLTPRSERPDRSG